MRNALLQMFYSLDSSPGFAQNIINRNTFLLDFLFERNVLLDLSLGRISLSFLSEFLFRFFSSHLAEGQLFAGGVNLDGAFLGDFSLNEGF